jgi:hypothetical protein
LYESVGMYARMYACMQYGGMHVCLHI